MSEESIWERIRRKDEEFKAWRVAHPGPLIEITSIRSGELFHKWTPIEPVPPMRPSSYHYIGRKNGFHSESALANPYPLHGEADRPRVLAAYRQWFQDQLYEGSPVWRELLQVMGYALEDRGIALGCWCAPRPCHGEIIRDCILEMYQIGWRP